MRNSKWPDFLFTMTVRFVCGAVLGGLVCLLFTWKGILRAFSHDATYGPLIWLGLCGLIGGMVAIFTVAWWQTPWYRRDSEITNVWAGLGSEPESGNRPYSSVVKKSVKIKTVDEDGEQHEYSSMEELPPKIRSEIEALEEEARQEKGKETSITETSQAGNAITLNSIHRKSVSVYKIVDESGAERVYHSLDEMPPEIRAAIAQAEGKLKGKRDST